MIEGKIAALIDRYTVVINVGSEDGVKTGMDFVIFEKGAEIQDPETKKVLGNLEIVKGYVTATNVQKKFTTAESSKTVTTSSLIYPVFPFEKTERVPLPISSTTHSLKPSKKEITIGDSVREICT